MQALAAICIRRPVFASMLILTLVVIGATGYLKLGVDRFPSVDLPTVRVLTRLPGAAPTEAESQVSQPIEEAVNTVEGIQELRSISGAGSSFVMVTFDLDRDVDAAAQDVRDRVSSALNDLPREADPPIVAKANNDLSPVLTLTLAGNRPLRELTELADKIVKVQLERSSGVAEVEVVGGLERAINIWIDADRLAAYQLSINAVQEAIGRQNADVPGGNLTGPIREYAVRTPGRLTDPAAFNDLVVATRKGRPIRIRDLGWAEDGTKEQRSIARLDGVPTVSLDVRRQSDANTVAVIEGIKAKLADVRALLPADVRIEVIADQSRYIYEALHEIHRHLVLGSILACCVVLLFMRNWRAMVIAGIAIPVSVISTFGMMWALQFTLNSVTMLALVLMVGIVIDDAIVVLENTFRFVEEKRLPPMVAAREATAEIALAVMATTFSLVVIFVPVSFMSSVSGRFLFQFGLTAAVAVLVSLLVSFTLTPMMSARLLRSPASPSGGADAPRSRQGFYARIDRFYHRLLERALRHRFLVVAGAAAILLTSIPLYHQVRQEYIPSNTDEGEFDLRVTAPEGSSLAAMIPVMEQIESDLRTVRGVRMVLSSAGSGGMMGGVNSARFYIRLAPHSERVFSWRRLAQWPPWKAWQGNYSQRDVMQDIRRSLAKYPHLRPSLRNLQTFYIGGPNSDIDFALLGPDLEALGAYAEQLRLRAPELGLLDADTTLKLDKPELRIEIDRERAARLGVDTSHIASALRLMVGGDQEVSRFRDESVNDDYDVQLRLAEADRSDPATLARLYVPRRDGGLARLDNLVQVRPTQTASRIDRLDRQRQVSLRAAIAPGYALADRLAALRKTVEEMRLPLGYSTRVSGRAREMESTFREFLGAFLLSVILMYIILASQFESLSHPFTILLSLPLSLPFALLTLWLAGQTVNLYSALGILVLFGVVKKNAILQVDHTSKLRAGGLDRHTAILRANRDRLRPILMTTMTLVAGMLPLALGTGPGAEERRATALVVIGGQSLCLLLTLIVTPVAYTCVDDIGGWIHRHFRRGLGHPEPIEAGPAPQPAAPSAGQ
ncbi:MAG TPA: efflux RND transporter permease subunit [Candidatus Paceibacterota bacterium]|nr:efflux RND transporter permease subunit [Verrucomicrobiota bacterium]HOX04462.1 efflux RND transporter permease subunit [Verrucomicrobiota bacterium]HRZ47404.1 efflux RND transporter permease subunit [Candidatus Paceibacterota bacterium]